MKNNFMISILSLLTLTFFYNFFGSCFYKHEFRESTDSVSHIDIQFNIVEKKYIIEDSLTVIAIPDNIIAAIDKPKSFGTLCMKENKKMINILPQEGVIKLHFNLNKNDIKSIKINYNSIDIDSNIIMGHEDIIKLSNEPNIMPVNQESAEIKNIVTKSDDSFLDNILNKFKNSNFLLITLITFILGILMSLTPCIYPMIPITISILGIDRTDFRNRLKAGLLYVAGISLTFSILGILAASGKLFFGELLSLPIFTIITTVVLFFMTLQMLGINNSFPSITANFKIPDAIQNSRFLPFFYGIFSGTITSPCVSPGLIAILSLVGQQSNIFIGWLWLFSFGVGLSLPLLIIALAMNNQFIFPKSGNWMNELKEIIGLALIIILKKNISYLVNNYIATGIIILLLIYFIIKKYLNYQKPLNSNKYWFCSFSVFFAVGFIMFFSYHFIDEKYYKDHKKTIINIQWNNNYEESLRKAQDEKKLLLLDFTADWCSICQLINSNLFTDNNLISAINNYYIFNKIDCTNMDLTKELLLKKYNINGFPSILIINPSNEIVLKRYSGDILNIEQDDLINLLIGMYKKNYEHK